MKKITTVFIGVIWIVFVLAGCQGKSEPVSGVIKTDKVSVVTTIFPPYDFTREIAGETVDLKMLILPGAEVHSYEPTPQDIVDISNCDIFIYVGGESDEWVDRILASIDTKNMEIISLMDLVNAAEVEIVEGMEEPNDGHGHGDEAEYDEHVWTSPANAKEIVQAISNTLCEVDRQNAPLYQENTKIYLGKLDELDAEFQSIVDSAARKTLVFGDRFPLRYLADAYGLTYYAAFSNCGSGTEASASTIAFLIDKVNTEKIPVVFHVEFSNEKIADTICESTGAKKMLYQSCHNVTRDDFIDDIGYLDLMRQNAETLKEALQ